MNHRSPNPTTPAVEAIGLNKTYGSGATAVHPLRDVSVRFDDGRFTAVMGPSGSGKSTLMHVLAGLDTVDSGRIRIGDQIITDLSEKRLTRARRDHIGFVFQAYNLVPSMTAEQNITLPARMGGRRIDRDHLAFIVERLGLTERLGHRPHELSGGQQQRVAVARALASRPDVIFADEPTGNLDQSSGNEVLNLLRAAVDEFGHTVVMVTHDVHAASIADRAVFLEDGRIVDDIIDPSTDVLAHVLAEVVR